MKVAAIKVLAAAGLISIAAVSNAKDITGAGASFPAPLYAQWADAYHKATGARVNYQSVGSGAGVRQIKGKTVDFGASDAPLKDDELKESGLMQFPTVVGGVVPVINVKGIKAGELRLSGQVLGDIYLGKIKKWNDSAIVALNKGVELPNAPIAVVRRADGSGTTFIWTNYLSKVNADWKANVGVGKAVKWPVGTGGKGNEGVAAFVQRLPNSIGYVEYSYAKQNKLTHTLVQNRSGAFVGPDDSTFKAAAAGADWSKSFYQILTDQPGERAWPITGATFILVYVQQDQPEQGEAVLKFFDWAYNNADQMATDLDYVPVPPSVEEIVRKAWLRIHDTSGKKVYKR